MAYYTFQNKETGKEQDFVMPISELDAFKANNPHLEQVLSALGIADPTRVGVTSKPDEGFRDILRQVKKNNWKSNINTF